MNNKVSPNRGPEKPLSGVEKKERKIEDSDIKQKSQEIAKEVVESAESAEFVEGKISEEEGKGKKKVSSGLPTGGQATGAASLTDDELPEVNVMRIQVSTRVKKEIHTLEKEATRIKSSPNFSPFKFNKVISRIRQLKSVLANLAHATADGIKSLWVKYVQ